MAAVFAPLFTLACQFWGGRTSSTLTDNPSRRVQTGCTYRTRQKMNLKEKPRSAAMLEDGDRRGEPVSEGRVGRRTGACWGRGGERRWPNNSDRDSKRHRGDCIKVRRVPVEAVLAACLSVTLPCALRAWKVPVGGSECRQQVPMAETAGRGAAWCSDPIARRPRSPLHC